MSKGFRIFDKNNPKAMSEWDKINSAIMGGGGKRKMTSQDVERFEEMVVEHNSSNFSDEATARHTPKHILEANGGMHWKPLEEYKPICSSHPTWSVDDPGDKKSLYWPYIPNDDELMEEILRDRPGAKSMIKEHKKTVGWEITEDSKKHYHRKEGF
jgi:hypothetical protein